MSEQTKDYERIILKQWIEKSKQCPVRMPSMKCHITIFGICEFESCPFRYWGGLL